MEWYTTESENFKLVILMLMFLPKFPFTRYNIVALRRHFIHTTAGMSLTSHPDHNKVKKIKPFFKMEWYTTESGKYRIESLSAATFPGALQVIGEAFCQDEAICIGSEVNKNPVAVEELLELCADAALDGVSLVAVATDTNEVVAVVFNKIQVAVSNSSEKTYYDVFAEERCTQASSRSLIQITADLDRRCNLFQKYGIDCSLEIMFLATDRKHRQQKLGYFLSKICVDLAKKLKNGPVSQISLQDLGPKYSSMKPREVPKNIPKTCHAICSGDKSQMIRRALNFAVELTVPMKEFVHNGKTYADRLGDQSAFMEVVAFVLN